MLAQEIKIRGEPTADPQKCRFVLDGEVLSRASLTFDNESEMDNAPLAKKLLNLPYIAQVNIAGQVVTLTGDNIESWPAVGKEIGGVIREQIKSGEAPVTEEVMDVGNRTLFDEVNELIKSDVNPSIASHGGVITLQNVSDGKAYVTMGGGCQGCSASSVTLKQGVKSYLVAKVDGINEVVLIAVTVDIAHVGPSVRDPCNDSIWLDKEVRRCPTNVPFVHVFLIDVIDVGHELMG